MNSQHTPVMPRHFRRHPMRQLVLAAWAGISATALIPAGSALAQAAAPAAEQEGAKASTETTATLGTVYVTARKRAELQIDVPVSVKTMSEKDLKAADITNFADLATQSGFQFQTAMGTGAYGRANGMVVFRGLQGGLARPNENSGGVFLDGIAVAGGIATLGFTDVSQVEVLKGPQNAFFGRSTFGGAVNFITRAPSSQLRGAVNTTLNSKGSIDADANIEGALVESGMLTGRLSVSSHNKQASYRTTDGGELGAESTRSATGTLFFQPTDKLWMRLRGTFAISDDSQAATGYLPGSLGNSCVGKTFTGIGRDGSTVTFTPGTAYYCGSIPKLSAVGNGVINMNTAIPSVGYSAWVQNSLNEPFLNRTPKLDHTGMRSKTQHASYQLGYSLPNDMDLAVNIGYNQADTTALFDLDRTGTQNFMSLTSTPTDDFTMDARLSGDPSKSLRWLVGASRYSGHYGFTQVDFSPALGGTYATTPYVNTGYYNSFASTVPAVYGSVEYDISKQWTAALEARYQEDKVVSYSRTGTTKESTTKNTLPRVTLRFKPNSSTTVYGNYAEGVQPLTTNVGYTNASDAGKALLEELIPGVGDFTEQPKLKAFELGVKQRIGNRFQYAVAVYDQKWTGRLTSTNIFNPIGCTTTYTTDCPLGPSGAAVQFGNDARIRGIEAQIDAQVTPQITAGASIDYKRARWERYVNSSQSSYGSYKALALTGTAVQFDGNTLGQVPDWQISLNGTYRFPLSKGWAGYVRGDLTYVGKQWESDMNFAQLDAYARTDLRLGFEKAEQSIELFVKNVANDRSWTSVARVPNLGVTPLTSYALQGVMVTPQEGRTFGVRMRYAF